MLLRVEKEDGAPLPFIDALYRETVGRFLSGILCIGYLLTLADRDNRALHDRLCDTRVVYAGVRFRPGSRGERRASAPPAQSGTDYGYLLPGAPAPAEPEPVQIPTEPEGPVPSLPEEAGPEESVPADAVPAEPDTSARWALGEE